MEQGISGVILASGQGSRLYSISEKLGLPKHLFPLGRSSIIGRLIKQLAPYCQEILCIVPEPLHQLYENQILSAADNLLPIKNRPRIFIIAKQGQGFRGDFQSILKHTHYRSVLLSLGDLILSSHDIQQFYQQASNHKQRVVLALDRRQLLKPHRKTLIDLRIILAMIPRSLMQNIQYANPESIRSGLRYIPGLLLRNKFKLLLSNVMYNINKPSDYHQALVYFSQKTGVIS